MYSLSAIPSHPDGFGDTSILAYTGHNIIPMIACNARVVYSSQLQSSNLEYRQPAKFVDSRLCK